MVGDEVEGTRDPVAATVVVVVAVAVVVGEIWTFPSGKAVEVSVEILRAIVAEEVIGEDVESSVVIIVAAVAGTLEVVETSAVVEEGFEAAATTVRGSSSEYIDINL